MSTKQYISEPNKHIEEYFDYYFDGKKNFEYAVLLNGAWGSGKTWFVRKYLEKKEDQGKKICYVSLNGIAKTSMIDEAIFKSIHPILGSKGAKLAGQILKGTLKATIKVDLDGDSKSDGSVSGGIPKIELPNYLTVNDNFILVFDDLERCELKKEEVLGYINYFVEQDNIKTLIVSNEDEIKDNDDYARKKEKLIGATFSYTEDQDLAIQSILQEIEIEELRNILISNLELIKKTFNQVGYKNLRSFKQAIFDFERFYKKEYFEYKNSFCTEVFEKVLKIFLILSLESKKGRFEKEILNLKINEDKSICDQGDCQRLLQNSIHLVREENDSFYQKYQIRSHEYIFSKKLWDQILRENLIDDINIKNELYKSYFRLKEEKPIWFQLWNYRDLEQKEFDDLVVQAKKALEHKKLNFVGDIAHTFSMLLYLKDINLIYFNVENLLDTAIQNFKDKIVVKEEFHKFHKSLMYQGGISYSFYAKDIPLFQKFLSRIAEEYECKFKENNSARIEDLLLKMESDIYEFKILMSSKYYDYPILTFVEPLKFISKLLEINFEDAFLILDILDSRYKNSSSNMYKEEQVWFESVIELFEKKLRTFSALKQHVIKDSYLPKLKGIRED